MPSVYYNEFDPKAAAWLRELMEGGLIPAGDVDERSIIDVRAADLAGYTQCHFFAGIGGWSYALRLAGWPDDRAVWTASCPCQPFSVAGKQEGHTDTRDLWPAFWRIASERHPDRIFGEQVANSVGFGWIDRVRADVEKEAYALGIAVLGAHSAGAPHIRQRLYWVANAEHAQRRPEYPQYADAYGRNGSGGRGAPGWLAESMHAERRPLNGTGKDGCDGAHGGRQEACGVTGACGEVCGLGDTNCSGSQGWSVRPDQYSNQWIAGEAGQSNGVGNADVPGRATLRDFGVGEIQRSEEPAYTGAWSDFDRLPCTDGKTRLTQPGLQPLANGVPARMVRLRGYGNAIVPQTAALFIRACLAED
jgi:DNA (cytosine-5)-methyltransferase 1